ncbi:MAG: multiprotein bridging factor aMBF1 [Candidatus Heimdallarchaeaceae archaeon]
MATCEMCGREIFSKPISIEIEGAILEVCSLCAKHGKRVKVTPTKKTIGSKPQSSPLRNVKTSYSSVRTFKGKGVDTKELVPDYAERVRLARQKMKLTQKEVSIQTKISVQELQSIETGKIRPSDILVRKLEKFFGIKLTEEVKDFSPQTQKKSPAFQTLGDIVVIKKKKDED